MIDNMKICKWSIKRLNLNFHCLIQMEEQKRINSKPTKQDIKPAAVEEPQYTIFEARMQACIKEIYAERGRSQCTPNKFHNWHSNVLEPTLRQLLKAIDVYYPSLLAAPDAFCDVDLLGNICFVDVAEYDPTITKMKSLKVPKNLFFIVKTPNFYQPLRSGKANDEKIYLFYTNSGNQKQKWALISSWAVHLHGIDNIFSAIKSILASEYDKKYSEINLISSQQRVVLKADIFVRNTVASKSLTHTFNIITNKSANPAPKELPNMSPTSQDQTLMFSSSSMLPNINMADLIKPDGKKQPAPQTYKIFQNDSQSSPPPSRAPGYEMIQEFHQPSKFTALPNLPKFDNNEETKEVDQAIAQTLGTSQPYQMMPVYKQYLKEFRERLKSIYSPQTGLDERQKVLGSIFLTPYKEKSYFPAQVLMEFFQSYKTYNQGSVRKTPRVLFISLSQSIGDQTVKELVQHKAIVTQGETLTVESQISKPALALNYCTKNRKAYSTKEQFDQETKQYNVIVISSNQASAYVILGILSPADFDLLILEDLTSFKDKIDYLQLIQDFLNVIPVEERCPLVSFYSQIPYKCETDLRMLDWMRTNIRELQSTFVIIPENQLYLCTQPLQVQCIPWLEGQAIESYVIDELIFQQQVKVRSNADSILILVDIPSCEFSLEFVTFSSEKGKQMSIAAFISEKVQNSKIKFGSLSPKKFAYGNGYLEQKVAPNFARPIFLMSIQFYRANKQDVEALFEKNQVTKLLYFAPDPATTSVTDVRELYEHASDSQYMSCLQVFVATQCHNLQDLLRKQAEYLNTKYSHGINILKFVMNQKFYNQFVELADPYQILPNVDPRYFITLGGSTPGAAKIHLRSGKTILLDILSQIVQQCDHKTCKLGIQTPLDPIRKHDLPVVEYLEIGQKQPAGYLPKFIVLPHCLKTFECDIELFSELNEKAPFNNKKESEGYACLQVIKKFFEKAIIDKHCNVILQLKGQQSLDNFPSRLEYDNGYIQKPISTSGKKLYVHVFTPKVNYPFVNTKQRLGILFDRDVSHMNLSYSIQVSQQTLMQHREFLKNAEMDINLAQSEQKIEYSMNSSMSFYFENYEEKQMLLNKLKFFHTYQYYQMSGLEHVFMKKVLKRKFSFSGPLFSQVIRKLWKRHGAFLQEMLNGDYLEERQLPQNGYLHYMYIVPVINISGSNKIDMGLLDNLVAHMQMKILCSIESSYDSDPSSLHEIPLEQAKGRLWSQMTGYNMIQDSVKVGAEKWQELSLTHIPKYNKAKFFDKGDKLTLPQFFLTMQGVQLDQRKSKYFYSFSKLPNFLDCVALKNFNKKSIGHEDFGQDLKQVHWTPSQTIEVNPISYEYYALMQHSCSHLLKLNDFLRVEAFIRDKFLYKQNGELSAQKKVFKESIDRNLSERRPKFLEFREIRELSLKPQGNANSGEELRQQMYDNLPLVNASLTASSTQMQANNERLESYGDSLIAFLVILELFITRNASDFENELDSMRKSRTQNDLMMLQNLTSGVWEHMLVEPQTQQSFGSTNSLSQESSIGSQNIIKVMTPGGLGDDKFKNKLKTIKDLTIQQRIWQFKQISYKDSLAKKASQNAGELKEGKTSQNAGELEEDKNSQNGGIDQEKIVSLNNADLQQYLELLNLLLKKKTWLQSFKQTFPDHYDSLKELFKSKPLHLQDYLLTVAHHLLNPPKTQNSVPSPYLEPLPSPDLEPVPHKDLKPLTSSDLKSIILNANLEKLMATHKKQQDFARSYPASKLAQKINLEPRNAYQVEASMKVKIQKDKKLADAVEAMVATVGMAGGIAASYEYLRSIDIVKTEIRVLQKRLDELLNFTEPAIFTEIEDNYAIYRMDEVEAKINYKFKNRTLLMQAFTHRTFSDYLYLKKGIRLQDYNVLEFLGDSLLNYLVLDFFYRHSQAYAEDYTHDVMHRLKSEITNNNFFGFVMVETGLCEKILKVEKCNFNEHFQFYIDIIRDSLSNREEGTGRSSSTREIYEDFYVSQVGLEEELKGVDMRKEFMKPQIMEKMATLTQTRRLNMEDSENYKQKIMGDVLEALFAAIFIDSGCDLSKTREVFMNIFEPYLYVYGNPNTTLEHPRTEAMNLWAKQQVSNIKNYKIAITHTNESESNRQFILYRGFLGGTEVINERFKLSEKNKSRQFFSKLKHFLKDLIDALYQHIPNLDREMQRLHLKEHSAMKLSSSPLDKYQSSQEVHTDVMKFIDEFRLKWNKRNREGKDDQQS